MKLSIDAGTFSIKILLKDDRNCTVFKAEEPHHNNFRQTAQNLLEQMKKQSNVTGGQEILFGASGSMSHLLNADERFIFEEDSALSEGFKTLPEKYSSMILLGAQKTWYVKREKSDCTIRRNTNCSAGTGSFFEEQAGRLNIRLEDISTEVSKAKSVPVIAGRCSVFSKTDMIHHMQEGVPTSDILLGLCHAILRNYRLNILKNKKIQTPVYCAGGVMKNTGVVSALKQELQLEEKDYTIDENSGYIVNEGICRLLDSHSENRTTLEKILADLTDEGRLEKHFSTIYKPLYLFKNDQDFPEFTIKPCEQNEAGYLGIDVGSTSINLVVLNSRKQMLYYSYVKNLGKPFEIVKQEIETLKYKLPQLKLEKISVTGSGREYIGKETGASLVINEITAQTEGALLSHENTDTIFEIGGQDSKYMSVAGGKMVDFEMNKVCAAGTGAFLEEQIKKLGISMEQFMSLAMESEHPCELGDRCTVFIEGSINRALAEGNSMADVCAGLAYAIASNYLHRVVNQKPVGDSIAVQGGIAYNKPVVCAFRALTGKNVHVTPYFSVTGALGAASLLMNQSRITFDKEKNQKINAILLKKSEESYLQGYTKPDRSKGKKVVGIPRVIFLHKMFPLFNTLFTKLGYQVLLSPLTNSDIIRKAQDNATADCCYPIKLIYGHIAWLLEQGVDYIVLPRLYTIKHNGSVARKDYACMYMQTAALLMEQAFGLKEKGVKLIMPELSLNFGKRFMLNSIISIGKQIDVPAVRMIPAAVKGFSSLLAHSQRLEKIGKESLSQGNEPIFVLISRVYNIIDPVLNMGIEEHLNSLGCRVVHLEHLEASYMNVKHDYKDMYWPFGQHILTGLKLVKANRNLYPIYITNHGCGPDTAIQHFFQNEMQGRDYLHLEVDEHSSKVGIITRLEAFLYSIQPQTEIAVDSIKGPHWGKDADETGCSTNADEWNADKILIPNLGKYTAIVEKNLPQNHRTVVKAAPVEHHNNFTYAMNKEYYSMLVMLEELLAVVEKNVSYDFVVPVDEGSEVFGQYGLLCFQELNKRGYDIRFKPFYLEDIIKKSNAHEIFSDMVAAEKYEAAEVLSQPAAKRHFILGEPLCVEKQPVMTSEGILRMPYSEVLLFHMMDWDRHGKYTKQISAWKKIHDDAMNDESGKAIYTDMEQLRNAAKGVLDFCEGNGGRYRLSKMQCLTEQNAHDEVLLNSAEENVSIILKQLAESVHDRVSLPVKQFDLDFEHRDVKLSC